jgi:hypothetical protein
MNSLENVAACPMSVPLQGSGQPLRRNVVRFT